MVSNGAKGWGLSISGQCRSDSPVWLGAQERDVHAGAIVFIPSDSWISLKNTGSEDISLVFVFSDPGSMSSCVAYQFRWVVLLRRCWPPMNSRAADIKGMLSISAVPIFRFTRSGATRHESNVIASLLKKRKAEQRRLTGAALLTDGSYPVAVAQHCCAPTFPTSSPALPFPSNPTLAPTAPPLVPLSPTKTTASAHPLPTKYGAYDKNC